MSTVALAYAFTCLGFCLGFVVAAIFRMPPADARAEDQTPGSNPSPPGGYHARTYRDSHYPPPQPPPNRDVRGRHP